VLLDDQQIALGSIPDVGLRRAFANRDVPGPEGKHRFIQVPAFDFFVRIPKAHVSDANLPKLTIVLHNVRQAPDRLVPATALQRQSGIETKLCRTTNPRNNSEGHSDSRAKIADR
jgi:hypothetical protein